MKGIFKLKKDKKKEKSDKNDKNKKYDYCISAMILGESESGKTTLQRQLELLYGLETYDPKYYQRLVYGNTLATLIRLIENTEKLNLTLESYDSQERVKRVLATPIELARNRLPRFPLRLSYDCKCLWEDNSIQLVYNHSKFCSDYRTPGRVKYYMDNMFRVLSPDFAPTEMDVISAYDQVDKSQTSSILHRRLKMELVCCPGKLSNSKEWSNLYTLHHPHYIFYVVSLKDYNIDNINSCSSSNINGIEIPDASKQICSHHSHKNQLIESLTSFESLSKSELFEKSNSVILIFNISEIFSETIKLFDLKVSFPDYEGGNDTNKAISYIINRFTKFLNEKNKTYKTFVINLLEKQIVKEQYEHMMDFLIPDAEKRNLIFDMTSPNANGESVSLNGSMNSSSVNGNYNSLTVTSSSSSNNTTKGGRLRGHSDSSAVGHPSSILPPSSTLSIGSNSTNVSNTTSMIQSLNEDVDDSKSDSSINSRSSNYSATTTTTTTTTTTSNSIKSPSKVKDKKTINVNKSSFKKKSKKGLQGVTSGFHSMQGRRKNMEDTHAIIDDLLEAVQYQGREAMDSCSYYAVYDGHGGTETSLALEPIVHKCITDSASFRAGNYPESLREGFEAADRMVIPKCEKSGSTGVSCMIVGNSLYVANIGDSEAVLGRHTAQSNNKNPTFEHQLLTYKHLANDEIEKKRVTELGGMIIFGRLFGSLAVARSFGDKEYKEGDKKFVSNEPYQIQVDLTPKDKFIILACDGLWDQVNYDEAVQHVAKSLKAGKSPTEISAELAQNSWEQGSVDNITVLVVVLNWK